METVTLAWATEVCLRTDGPHRSNEEDRTGTFLVQADFN